MRTRSGLTPWRELVETTQTILVLPLIVWYVWAVARSEA